MPKIPPEYNLSTLGGQNIEELPLNKAAEDEAEMRLKSLEKSGVNKDQVAELTWLTRLEILSMLKDGLPQAEVEPELSDSLETGGTAQGVPELPSVFEERTKKIKALLKKDKFQKKIAYYKKLLEKSGQTLQKELGRHQEEKDSINGLYAKYQQLSRIRNDLEAKLTQTMAELFAERGKDPDSMVVETRAMLEEGIETASEQMDQLKTQNPDVAALLEYDKITSYSGQLQKNDFIWTESRKDLLREALKKVVAGRPMIVLMGESGTGKTAMANAIAKELTGREAMREVGGSEARFKDSLAARAIDKEGSFYDFGPVLQAMTGMNSSREKAPNHEGAVYFDDEFNTRPAGVQRQILKFIAEAKPGRYVTVPGTDLKVKVQPRFLYIAAGNPPSVRYEREETPVEAYRELAGILDVDYLEQTKNQPELTEFLAAGLMDQKTRRLRVVATEEFRPGFVRDVASGKQVVDENPLSGGFLWRFSNAWKELLKSFSQKENALTDANPGEPPEKYHLQKFVLDVGKVRGWLNEFKASRKDQQRGIEAYLTQKMRDELKSYPQEDIDLVKEFFKYFDIELSDSNLERVTRPSFQVMTPKETGYLFSNVPRPIARGEVPSPKGKIVILPDGSEVEYEEKLPQGFANLGMVGDEIQHKKNNKRFTLLGQTSDGQIVLESKNQCSVWAYSDVVEQFVPVESDVPKEYTELFNKLERSYDEMKDTLTDFGFTDAPPSRQTVMDAIKKLSPEKLKEIVKFGKPTILMTPKGSFESQVKAIDGHRKMPNQADKTYCDPVPTDGIWGSAPAKMVVTVVDGLDAMPLPPYITNDLNIGQKMDKYEEEFAKQKLDVMGCQEGAMLMMQSLRRGQPIDEVNSTQTVTYYNRKHLTKSSAVPCGFWDSNSHQVGFRRGNPVRGYDRLRCRPSVRVLET